MRYELKKIDDKYVELMVHDTVDNVFTSVTKAYVIGSEIYEDISKLESEVRKEQKKVKAGTAIVV